MADKTTPAEPTELSDKDVAQVTGGIGAQSTGAGAGKVTFNPFGVPRKPLQEDPEGGGERG